MASIKTNKLIALSVKPGLLISALSLSLAGCEAPLNLEKVEQELSKSIRRTDQFQSMASNDQVMVVVGNNGLVLTSPINEQQWQRQTLNNKPALVDVTQCPDQSFVALSLDKTLWRSSDNGSSWHSSPIDTQEDVLALTCAPDNSIWVVGSFSTILNSSDQGTSWNTFSLNEDALLTGIRFVDNNTVIATGEFGVVAKSENGGQDWNPPEYIPNDFYTQGAVFTSTTTGWVGGLSGQILHTTDGGMSWQQQTTPTESPIYGFQQAGSQLFAFGDHNTVLTLNGDQWQRVETHGKPVYLRAATQLSNNELLIAGGSGSLFTLDISSGATQLSQK